MGAKKIQRVSEKDPEWFASSQITRAFTRGRQPEGGRSLEKDPDGAKKIQRVFEKDPDWLVILGPGLSQLCMTSQWDSDLSDCDSLESATEISAHKW